MRRWHGIALARCVACSAFGDAASQRTADAGEGGGGADASADADGGAATDAAEDDQFAPIAEACRRPTDCNGGQVCCVDVPARKIECRLAVGCGASAGQYIVCASQADCPAGKTCDLDNYSSRSICR